MKQEKLIIIKMNDKQALLANEEDVEGTWITISILKNLTTLTIEWFDVESGKHVELRKRMRFRMCQESEN